MHKIYCYDCDKDVWAIKKQVLEQYDFRGKSFEVTLDLFYCPLCGGEIAGEEELDNILGKAWEAYWNCNQ